MEKEIVLKGSVNMMDEKGNTYNVYFNFTDGTPWRGNRVYYRFLTTSQRKYSKMSKNGRTSKAKQAKDGRWYFQSNGKKVYVDTLKAFEFGSWYTSNLERIHGQFWYLY
jgi:hypothetical protein